MTNAYDTVAFEALSKVIEVLPSRHDALTIQLRDKRVDSLRALESDLVRMLIDAAAGSDLGAPDARRAEKIALAIRALRSAIGFAAEVLA